MRLNLNPLRFSAKDICEEQLVLSKETLYFSLLNYLKADYLKDSSMTFLEDHIFNLKPK